MGLIYALLVVMSLGDKKFLIKTEDDSLTADEVKDMVLEAQKAFKDKGLRGKQSKVGHCKNLCSDLVYGIATRFYPDSKYPLLELSVEESIMLVGYIQKRIDELLDKKVLSLFKRLKVSQIAKITKKTSQVMDSKFYEIGKNINGASKAIRKAINVINPAWWFKKVVTDNVTNIILNKLCLVVIAVVGEETYKIYSKTIFNEEISIESNVDALMESLNDDLSEVKREAMNNAPEEYSEVMDRTPLLATNIRYKRRVYSSDAIVSDYTSAFIDAMPYKKRNISEAIEAINIDEASTENDGEGDEINEES